MLRTRVLAIATALALGSAALAGCGGSSKTDLSDLSTTKLLAKAAAQVKQEKYVEVEGKIDNSGSETGLDLSYVDSDSHGTITIGGASLELETVDGKTYFKPSDAFWTAQMGAKNAKSVINRIKGRWIVADPNNQNFSQLIQLASKDFVTKEILSPADKVTKGKNTKIHGIDCIALKMKSGTLYLDKETARPVQIVGSGSGGSGTADFTYTKIDTPTAPAAADQVDIKSLAG